MGKAEEWFRSAIEADPGYGDPYTNMGMLRWKTDQKEEAVDLFEKGFILSPDKGDLITGYYQAIQLPGTIWKGGNRFSGKRGRHIPKTSAFFFC